MSNSHRFILETIGNTPLVELRKIPEEEGVASRVLVKLEFFNPTGSHKDRAYKEMITGAVNTHKLSPGMEILEVSTGNAGIACTFVGRLLGYQVTIIMPEGMSEERKTMIQSLGGRIIHTPGGESDVDLSLKELDSLLEENPGRYWSPKQFENPDNPSAHYKTTGPELWKDSEGNVDCFLASQGSGGTLTGVGRYLRERRKDVKLFAVEPTEAPVLSHGHSGSHRIEGIGDGFVPKNLDLGLLDGVVTVSSEEAVDMTRRLIRDEGIFCGISSGCNVAAAIKLSSKHPVGSIATIINDSGNRYLSTEVFGVRKEKKIRLRPETGLSTITVGGS